MRQLDVHIHTNSQCNLKCKHCYEGDTAIKSCLSDRLETAIIGFLFNYYNADIHLEGGEVFLEEHLLRALSSLDKSAMYHLTITTNGTLITQDTEVLRVLRSINCLRISVEGHTNDLHRRLRNYDLQPILDNAHYYKQQGIPVVLRITLNQSNRGVIFSEVIPSLEEKGFDRFQIYEIQPVGRALSSDICISGRLDDFLLDWINHPTMASVNVSLPVRRKQEIDSYGTQLEQTGIISSDVGDVAGLSIGADGSVRVCAWDVVSLPLTYITEDNLEVLHDVVSMQTVSHACVYCSRIVLKGN